MTKRNVEKNAPENRQTIHWLASFILALAVLATITGCQSDRSVFNPPASQASDTNGVVTLREGDVLKISFPGSPSLNTVQTIPKNGIITLPLVGQIQAAGESPTTLDQKLIDLYAPQLTTKQVTVEVQSAPFPIYVTGAVLRPGKIMSDPNHSITALEAVMEAGGFNPTTADMKNVVLIRKEVGGTRKYTLNLKAEMEGKSSKQFYLESDDILFVPEKFTWF